MSVRTTRTVAGIAVLLTALGVCYVLASLTGWDPPWGPAVRALMHAGAIAVLVAMIGTGALGSGSLGRVGRIGLGIAGVGQLALVVAELLYDDDPGVADVLFQAGPMLAGVGMITAGIAVLRARVWTGARRGLPLLVGVWVLIPTIPVLIATGGPPATLALVVLAAWEVLWLLTGVAVLTVLTREHALAR